MVHSPPDPNQPELPGFPDSAERPTGKSTLSKSLLKSALQKAVRRGDTRLATQCFRQLWSNPETRESLLRRLPLIAVEERWDAIGEMAYAVGVGQRLLKKGVSEAVIGDMILKVVIRLVQRPKSKEAGGVENFGKRLLKAWTAPEMSPEQRLRDALELRNEIEGTAWALRMVSAGRKADMWGILFEFGARNGLECVRLVEAMQVRHSQGALQCDLDMLVAGGVVAVCRMTDTTEIPNEDDVALPWYCVDMHTAPGRLAMAVLIKRHGFMPQAMSDLWFHMESGVIIPENPEENKVWCAAQAADLRDGGWTWEEAQQTWAAMRDEARELVQWALTKRS